MIKDFPILEYCPLFVGLPIDAIYSVLDNVHYQIKTYNKDNLIVYSGETVDKLFIVLSGSVKGEMIDYSGKSIKIEDIDPPRPLAVAFLFGKSNTYPVNIIANKESQLLSIPKASVLHMFQKNEMILLNFLNAISNQSQFLSQKIKFLTFQTIKGKIANYLLQQSKGASEIVMDKTQIELAELFGVTRPSVGRGMRELHNEGIIDASGKNVRLLNIQALRECLR